ncbi:MAG: hypothetical protein LBL74_03710 [Bacteroidales bacterium]|nr:hypothetical protein [Bacteroidales bacterium]
MKLSLSKIFLDFILTKGCFVETDLRWRCLQCLFGIGNGYLTKIIGLVY